VCKMRERLKNKLVARRLNEVEARKEAKRRFRARQRLQRDTHDSVSEID